MAAVAAAGATAQSWRPTALRTPRPRSAPTPAEVERRHRLPLPALWHADAPTASVLGQLRDALVEVLGPGEFDRLVTSHFYGHLLPPEGARFAREAWRVSPELVVADAARRDDVASEEWQDRELNDWFVVVSAARPGA